MNEPKVAQSIVMKGGLNTKSTKSTKAAFSRRGLRAQRAFVSFVLFVSPLAAAGGGRSKAIFGRCATKVKKQSQSASPPAHGKALLSYVERLG